MANLHEIVADAGDGEAIMMLSREFNLTPQQTEAAVAALLPAISTGLKRSTATPEGLGNLFGIMGQQEDLQPLYDDPCAACAQEGRAAGNDVLSAIFGSPEVSRAVADQAQQLSGVGSDILKKMLPVLAGLVVSGLMGAKPGTAAPQAPAAPSGGAGGLGDILGQIFGRGESPSSGPSMSPQQVPSPIPTSPGGQPAPGGDLLGYVLRELEQGLREGRIKPVIIEGGRFTLPGGQGGSIPMPGGQAGPSSSAPQAPGGDVLGQILRDILGGGGGPARVPSGQAPQMKDLSDLSKQLGVMDDGVGAAVFGDRFEVGRDVEQRHLDSIESVFDRFSGPPRR